VQETLARMFLTLRRTGERPSPLTDGDLPPATEDATVRIALAQALARLSPADRALLVLRYLHDRSVDQVAADLGRSPAAVRTGSRRALHRLRAQLGDEQLADLIR
jgi:RNA polymerase sigma factor (sigma-70 family)